MHGHYLLSQKLLVLSEYVCCVLYACESSKTPSSLILCQAAVPPQLHRPSMLFSKVSMSARGMGWNGNGHQIRLPIGIGHGTKISFKTSFTPA